MVFGIIGNMTTFRRWGRTALLQVCVYPHLSKQLVALLHGIRWAAPPGTEAPAQSKSSRTTEETSLPLVQTTSLTPAHLGSAKVWPPGVRCTISSCQVKSPAPLKPSRDLPAAFPRQPPALSPTTHLHHHQDQGFPSAPPAQPWSFW